MRLLQPLRRRDFALLFAGSTISLIGDGVYTVALAFQVYALDNSPGALSLVLLAYSAGLVVCALVAGVVVDRVDRRAVIVVADALQLVAILAMGLLSVAGTLEVWHCALLAVLVGAGTAFVKPAATALLPHVVPKEEIVAATSLEQSAQQASYALLGPALGGVLVGATGPGNRPGHRRGDVRLLHRRGVAPAHVRAPARPRGAGRRRARDPRGHRVRARAPVALGHAARRVHRRDVRRGADRDRPPLRHQERLGQRRGRLRGAAGRRRVRRHRRLAVLRRPRAAPQAGDGDDACSGR